MNGGAHQYSRTMLIKGDMKKIVLGVGLVGLGWAGRCLWDLLVSGSTSQTENPELILSLDQVREAARARIPDYVYYYYAFLAEDGVTHNQLQQDFAEVHLITRVLRDVSGVSTKVSLFGKELASPIVTAPTGFHNLVDGQGELASARACAEANVCYTYNYMASTQSIKDVASIPGPRWAAIYIVQDREYVRHAIQEIERLGFSAITVTCDHPHESVKEHTMPHFNVKGDGPFLESRMHFPNVAGYRSKRGLPSRDSIGDNDETLTWEDLAWLRRETKLPLICKGILSVEDAKMAVKYGADGIIVSNHGFRQMDATPSAFAVLPDIVAAVGNDTVVMVDSGFRRGTQVMKALALGAKAVLIGRPVLWGLGFDGQAGVSKVLKIINGELETAMKACGCVNITAVDSSVLYTKSS